MPYYMYVSLQDDDKIATYTMDSDNGKLTPKGDTQVEGGPSSLAISTELGMRPLMERVLSRRDILKA